jgi:hypothetical protein
MDEQQDYEFLKARYDILWEIARHYRRPSNWSFHQELEDCRVYAHYPGSGDPPKGYDFAKKRLDKIWDMEVERGMH